MAIKYVHVAGDQKTIAILENTKMDAVNKIRKMCAGTSIVIDESKYMMNDKFRAVVKCCAGDQYTEEEGKNRAKEKLLAKYYRMFDAKMDLFKANLIELNSKIFETPEELC